MGKKQNRIKVARHCKMIFGAVVLLVGLFSYYESATARKYDVWVEIDDEPKYVKFDEYCRIAMNRSSETEVDKSKSCPTLSLEVYYISAVIICFILSWIGLIASSLADFKQLKFIELGCHLVAAVLMLVAGILYLVFAGQVNTILLAFDNSNGTVPLDPYNEFKITEKRVAGGLAIAQALQFGYVAILVGMQ